MANLNDAGNLQQQTVETFGDLKVEFVRSSPDDGGSNHTYTTEMVRPVCGIVSQSAGNGTTAMSISGQTVTLSNTGDTQTGFFCLMLFGF